MKIGIVVGSIREGRVGDSIGAWVAEHATQHEGVTAQIVDLADFDLPVFTGAMPPRMLNKEYDNAAAQAFSAAIDDCDAFIFVTPEYNGSVPGAFKNAIDHIAPEWENKPVGFVGYSYHGGQRAIKHWRDIMQILGSRPVDAQVSLTLGSDVEDGAVKESVQTLTDLETMLTQLTEAQG